MPVLGKNLCYNAHMNKFLFMSVAIHSLKEFILFLPILIILLYCKNECIVIQFKIYYNNL